MVVYFSLTSIVLYFPVFLRTVRVLFLTTFGFL